MTRSIVTAQYVSQELQIPLVVWQDIHECGGVFTKDTDTGERIGVPGPNYEHFRSTYPDLVIPEKIDLDIIFEGAGSFRLFYEFLYYTGLRAGDVARLTYGNIDFNRRSITSLINKPNRFHEFPLAVSLIDKLIPGKKSEPLFPTLFAKTKKKMDGKLRGPREYMQALLRVKGRPKATLHSFRTTFNNTLRDLGLRMDDRQSLMAHSSSETTKIYTHPNFDLAKDWIDKMPRFS